MQKEEKITSLRNRKGRLYNRFRATSGLVEPSVLLESANLGKGQSQEPGIQGTKEKTKGVLKKSKHQFEFTDFTCFFKPLC